MHRGLQHTVRTSTAVITAVICGVVLPAGLASAQDDAASAHVSEAVQNLSALDAERVRTANRALELQDIIRQEVSICIDPSTGLLSADARLWVETSGDHIRLLLDDSLTAVAVTDSRGDDLPHRRTGRTTRFSSTEPGPTASGCCPWQTISQSRRSRVFSMTTYNRVTTRWSRHRAG